MNDEAGEVIPDEVVPADAMMSAARADLAADLVRIAADPAMRVYALFDGAQFDDIDSDLSAAALSHRSLYIKVEDRSLVDAGPWLVDFYATPPAPDPSDYEQAELPEEPEPDPDTLSDEALQAEADRLAADMKAALDAGDETGGGAIPAEDTPVLPDLAQLTARIDAAIALLEACPNAAVFWIGDATLTEAAIWKHARSINRVMIPREFAPEWDHPIRVVDTDLDIRISHFSRDDTDVMFRHADGNVIASVCPYLDENQFARLFGPADALECLAPEQPSSSSGSVLRRAVRPDVNRVAANSLMTLTHDQLESIRQTRLERSRKRIMAYLRKVAPEPTRNMPDTELSARTAEWMEEATDYGVKSEAAHGRWCYLQIITAGEMGKQKDVIDFVTGVNPGHTPEATTDERVGDLMKMAAARAGEVKI